MNKLLCLILCSAVIELYSQDSVKTIYPFNKSKTIITYDSLSFDSTNHRTQESLVKKSSETNEVYSITWHDWLTNIPKDYVQFYYKAINTSIPVYIGIAASTAALMATDHITYPNQHNWYKGSNFVHQASDRFAELGDGRTQFALTGIFLAYGLIFKAAELCVQEARSFK